ncbi:helix-turn-helix domain-containing protein [Nocardia uniformis]|uniref:Helix-turn-helix domain-containing protein n=1 Tax=Nocardia uniformis TaxID=53432 RepID=A0A849C3S8_9NOCA|nr:helix-turn-helix domain-containing protein [Nocardia uniformis]NNH73344.1 helix-turn-helix domain-containing protein [Nocardia uniformis]
MALTESEAKVLGALAGSTPAQGLTVRQLCERTGLCAGTIRHALHQMAYHGFTVSTRQSPVLWRAAEPGLSLVASCPALREFVPSKALP